MAQDFENIATTDFIDTGLLRLLARDLTALTVMSGESDPASSPNDAVIDNTTQGVLKINGDIIIDYKNKLLNSTALANRLQPLSSLLTNFSDATLVTPCFINTNGEVLGLTDYGVSAANRTSVDGSKTLAKKNVIGTPQIDNGSITQSKLATSLPEGSVFKCGDLVRSLNSNNRNGFLKLGSNYSIGSALSNATYRNNSYFDLYSLLWNNPNAVLRDLSLNIISKGATSDDDFANGNSIDLMASDDLSKYKTVEFNYTGDVQVYTVPKNVFYVKVECVGAAGGEGGVTNFFNVTTWDNLIYGDSSKGARATAILSVTPGETLYVCVGGKGGHVSTDFVPGNSANLGTVPGGYNGGGYGGIGYISQFGPLVSGGGGGGMTDIRTSTNVNDQIIVAAGGGGSFCSYNSSFTDIVTIYGGAGVTSTTDPLGVGEKVGSTSAYQPGMPGGSGAYAGAYGTAPAGTRGQGGNTLRVGAGGGGGYIGGGGGTYYDNNYLAPGGGINWVNSSRVVNNSYVSTSAYSEATGNGWAIITPIILPAITYIKY